MITSPDMYARHFEGSRLHELDGYVGAADIAKLMRAEIKAQIKAGNLPGIARNYSVRIDNYSMGRSINISTKDLEGLTQNCPGYDVGTATRYADGTFSARACHHWTCERGRTDTLVLNEEGQRVHKILKEIHGLWNYDASNSQIDYFNVNYYGGVKVQGEGY